MRITLDELRNIIQEELVQAAVATDAQLAVGKPVSVVIGAKPTPGKITGSVVMSGGRGTLWTVDFGNGRQLQLPAKNIQLSEEKAKSPEDIEKDDDKDGKPDNLLLDKDKDVNENVEKDSIRDKDDEAAFKQRHYEFLARQIMGKYAKCSPETDWEKVALSYVRGIKSSTGKTLDAAKLQDALERVVSDLADETRASLSKNAAKST